MPNRKARRLRQASTDAEQRMWSALRDRRLAKYKFRRQHPIGDFIVDFACSENALIVETDGGQHADDAADARRSARLERQGWWVVRFWENDVLNNTAGVIDAILRVLNAE